MLKPPIDVIKSNPEFIYYPFPARKLSAPVQRCNQISSAARTGDTARFRPAISDSCVGMMDHYELVLEREGVVLSF